MIVNLNRNDLIKLMNSINFKKVVKKFYYIFEVVRVLGTFIIYKIYDLFKIS